MENKCPVTATYNYSYPYVLVVAVRTIGVAEYCRAMSACFQDVLPKSKCLFTLGRMPDQTCWTKVGLLGSPQETWGRGYLQDRGWCVCTWVLVNISVCMSYLPVNIHLPINVHLDISWRFKNQWLVPSDIRTTHRTSWHVRGMAVCWSQILKRILSFLPVP